MRRFSAAMDPSEDSPAQAAAWIDAYRDAAAGADVLAGSHDPAAWAAMLEELAAVASNLAHARERVQRLKGMCGLTAEVEIEAPGGIERSLGKARRVIDRRPRT